MSFKKDFKDVLLKVLAGLIAALLISLGQYLYDHPHVQFSWIIISPINIFNTFYFSIPIPLRLNIFFWIMSFYIYYILAKYDLRIEVDKKRKIKEKNFRNGSFGIYSLFLTIGLLNIDKLIMVHNEIGLLVLNSFGIFSTILGFVILINGRVEINGLWGPHIYDYNDKNFNRLVTTGVYHRMRHPIYLGQSLLAFSTFLCSNSYLFILFPIIVMLLNTHRANIEEKHLEIEFGVQFAQYQNEVKKWWLY